MSDNCDDFFAQNTDISGIGVRVAFYLQVNILGMFGCLLIAFGLSNVFLLVVLVIVSHPKSADTANAFWTLTSMSLGLVVAAIASAAKGQLSFFNAIIVQDLVWCVLFRILFSVRHVR